MGLVEFLKEPSSYPDRPRHISLVQTHISWVFIGDSFVYKVKKPLDLGFLDFTTLERRRFFTAEELRLNRRFSPDVYLAVVPISQSGSTYLLDDTSNVMEYALKMRRIREENMLFRLLSQGKAGEAELRRVGAHLARIYATIPSDEKSRPFGSVEVIYNNVAENFDQTVRYEGGPVSEEAHHAIRKWSMDFLKNRSGRLRDRVVHGHIKECHGDLHLEHVCLEGDDIVVMDCIEFNERFRFCDVASDVAFLSMDLDYNGYSDLAKAFVDAYIRESADDGLMAVLKFYKVYRAYVRAKVTSFMLDDSGLNGASKTHAFETAKRYFDLALEYIRHDD